MAGALNLRLSERKGEGDMKGKWRRKMSYKRNTSPENTCGPV